MTVKELQIRLNELIEKGNGKTQIVMMDYMQTEEYFNRKRETSGRPLTTVEDIKQIKDSYFGEVIEIMR